MVLTRRGTNTRGSLAFAEDIKLLAHIVRSCALHNGVGTYAQTAAISRMWERAVQRAWHLSPASGFGELKAGKRLGRFDRPHGVAFLPSGDVVVADCDNFRLQFWCGKCGAAATSWGLRGLGARAGLYAWRKGAALGDGTITSAARRAPVACPRATLFAHASTPC